MKAVYFEDDAFLSAVLIIRISYKDLKIFVIIVKNLKMPSFPLDTISQLFYFIQLVYEEMFLKCQ